MTPHRLSFALTTLLAALAAAVPSAHAQSDAFGSSSRAGTPGGSFNTLGASGNSFDSAAGANVRGSANMEAGAGGRVGANLGQSSVSGSTSMGTMGSGSARIGPGLDSGGITGPTGSGLYGYGRESSPMARTGPGLDGAQSGMTDTDRPGYARDGRRSMQLTPEQLEEIRSRSVKIRPLTEPAMNDPDGAASAIVPPLKPTARN